VGVPLASGRQSWRGSRCRQGDLPTFLEKAGCTMAACTGDLAQIGRETEVEEVAVRIPT
jgi:hypothetical protein